jgi:hypothetical protein
MTLNVDKTKRRARRAGRRRHRSPFSFLSVPRRCLPSSLHGSEIPPGAAESGLEMDLRWLHQSMIESLKYRTTYSV